MLTGLRRISWNGCVNGFTGFVCLDLLVIAPTFPTLPKPTKEKKKNKEKKTKEERNWNTELEYNRGCVGQKVYILS